MNSNLKYFRDDLFELYNEFFKSHMSKFFITLENIKDIRYITGESNRSLKELYQRKYFRHYKVNNSFKEYLKLNIATPSFTLFIKQEAISSLIIKEKDNKWYGQLYNSEYYLVEYNFDTNFYQIETDTIREDIVDCCFDKDNIKLLIQYNSNKSNCGYPSFYNRLPYRDETNFHKKCYIIDLKTCKCSCPKWKFSRKCKHQKHIIKYKNHIFENLCLILSQYIDFNSAFCISKNYLK